MTFRFPKSDFVRQGAFVFAGVGFATFFGYVFFALLGRQLGVEQYGVVTSLVSAILVISAPATVAQLICARLAADLEARGDRPALRKLADVITGGTSIVVVVLVAAGFLFRFELAEYFRLADSLPITISLVAFAAYAVASVQRGVLQGAQHFGDYSLSLCVEAATKVVIGIALAGPLGVSGALIGVAVGSLAGVAYDLRAFFVRLGTVSGRLRLDSAVIKRVIMHVGVGQITLVILTFYDVPLVKHFFDPHTAGLYASAAFVGRAIVAIVSFVPTLVMPKVSARVAIGGSPLPLLCGAVGISAGIIGTALILAAFWPKFLVVLIAGRAFADAAPIVLPYALASGCLALAFVVSAYKTGLHRYDFVVPSFVAAIAEICVLSVWHPTLAAVVATLAVGHASVLVSMLYKIWSGQERAAITSASTRS